MDGLGKVMGRKVETLDTRFPNLITGLQAGRFDVTNSSMYITAERVKVIDMIPYLKAASRSSPSRTAPSNPRPPRSSAATRSVPWALRPGSRR